MIGVCSVQLSTKTLDISAKWNMAEGLCKGSLKHEWKVYNLICLFVSYVWCMKCPTFHTKCTIHVFWIPFWNFQCEYTTHNIYTQRHHWGFWTLCYELISSSCSSQLPATSPRVSISMDSPFLWFMSILVYSVAGVPLQSSDFRI